MQFAAAYALSKKDLPYKNIVVAFFTVQMFVGAGAIPTYVLYSKMHLLNSFWVYILPSLMSFYNVVIIRTFIQTTIPDSLYESAYIDGATDVTVFARIVIPLSKPVLATMALWTMVNHWNDWTTTLTYIRNPKLYTLQYKMMQLIKESDRMQSIIEAARVSGQIVEETSLPTSDGLIAAQVILSTLPIVCAYPFLQKYFVKGITIGAVKG